MKGLKQTKEKVYVEMCKSSHECFTSELGVSFVNLNMHGEITTQGREKTQN
jgi:hypothetical protein